VAIYVTEPLRLSTRVKADRPSEDPEDVVDAMKLNLVRDFQTGVYDYNTMTSVFAATSDFELLKVSFSSAEWCGHVYSEMRVEPESIIVESKSYFESETDNSSIVRLDGGLTGEELFVVLRGFKGDFLEPGESVTRPFLPSAYFRRLRHRPAEWGEVIIRRVAGESAVSVPVGRFDVVVYELETSHGQRGRFEIEAAWPHRIVRWSLGPDVEAKLTGSLRTAYWEKNREGDEALLEDLGLHPPR
jgi:hypothetical protein